LKMSKRARNRIIIGTSIVVILVISFVVLATLPGGAKTLDLSATLSEITGVVEVRNSTQDNYSTVDDGYILKMIQQLQTQQQSKVKLDLSTGSIVRIGQSTIFSLAQTQEASSNSISLLALQLGKIWIVLKGGSINVNTPGGLASVRGSYMSVWVEPGTNIITEMCLEGHCAFQNNAGTVELTSAQKIISTDPNVLPVVQPMDMSDIQSWLDNCPESAAIIPSILYLIATSTPTATPEITPTLTATPTFTVTPSPTATSTPYGWVNSLTATYSYYLTATSVYGTGTTTATATPTKTATLPIYQKATSTPAPTNPAPRPTQPPPPAPTATSVPPAPTATRSAYP
jgi:hypothetical protein